MQNHATKSHQTVKIPDRLEQSLLVYCKLTTAIKEISHTIDPAKPELHEDLLTPHHQVEKPNGLTACQRHESKHIAARSLPADQPSSSFASDASA
jgi:hypothetical protein